MKSPPPRISVVIVNYNAGEWLARSVNSVLSQSLSQYECFIVDNGSSDNSLDNLPEMDDRFHLIRAGENLGFAKANNLAAKKANGTWLALLNPDAFAHNDWLEKLLRATTLAPNVTMVGSTQFMALEDKVFDGTGDELHVLGLAYRSGHGEPSRKLHNRITFSPCGAGAFIHRETFMRLGGFDESFFCYHEDVDLAYRMRLDGGICIQSSEAKIDHISSGISGRTSDFAIYHGTRNRIWTFMQNTPKGLLPILLPGHLVLNFLMIIRSIFRPGSLKPTCQGIKDGFFSNNKSTIQRSTRKISYLTLLKSFGWSPIKAIKRLPVNTKPITKL